MDVVSFNKNAWNRLVDKQSRWTTPVSREQVENARKGKWTVALTPDQPVPADWFPAMQGLKVLALASAGGQQAPILAAAGAEVIVFDNSSRQLEQDTMVAMRDGLSIRTVEGDMANLSAFEDSTFDFIFHPCSNMFVPDVNPVWRECFRVLKKGGILLSGFCNPVCFAVDPELETQGIVQMKYKIPYSDASSVSEEERVRLFGEDDPIHFGHTLQDLIGGQIDAGFFITGFYEDSWKGQSLIQEYLNCYIATRAIKPS